MSAGRVPPHDLDAEAAVLSAVLLSPEAFDEIGDSLRAEHFYADANRRIFEAVADLKATARPVDVVTVATWLKDRERLGQVGGTPYLAQLTDAIPVVAHAVEHARVIRDKWRIRQLIATCVGLSAEGYGPIQDAEVFLQTAAAEIFKVTDAAASVQDTITTAHDGIAEEFDALVERSKSKALPGTPTRIRSLDRILGGLVDGVVYVVAGRPGHGKTALAWQLAEGVAVGGKLVAFLSQEMPRPQLLQRAIAQAANIEVEAVRYGRLSPDEWTSAATAVTFVQKLPVAIDDRSGHTVHSARLSVRRCVSKLRAKGHHAELGLVVLDYLQIMASEGGGRRETRATEVADNMHGLTQLAKELRCPVLALSQLNREIEKRPDKRPKLSDLGESGAIEADGYGVIFVYREDCNRPEEQHDGLAELIVSKNRNGRCGTAKLRYLPSTLFAGIADEFDPAFDDGERRHP